ncbi:MAG: serine/threonine-protein kinase [Polyangiaceae bacterium]
MTTDEPSSPAQRVGSVIHGKWTLEKVLGEGGMATVYVARHKIGRLEAVKIMHSMVAASPELRARFEQEARLANRFHHPGAVEIRDIDTTEDGAPFLVMELLEGETLSTIARRTKEPMDVATVLRVADEVLDVLAAAHATGIIHRDIKPDNLLLTTEGRVKVLDFGIARLREGMSRDVKTHTGTTLGTVAYMAPEQAKGGDVDARVDIYAVGATMFRLLAGRRVHEADTEAERLAKLMSGTAESLAVIAPHVPGAVCAIVDRAVAFERANRYPDALSMQADVRAARGEIPTSSSLGSRPATASAEATKPEEVTAHEGVTVREGGPAEEAATRVETGGRGEAAADDAPTKKSDGPPAMENLRTERMPGAPGLPGTALVAAVAAAPPAAGPSPAGPGPGPRMPPSNRPYILIAASVGALGAVLLIIAAVLAVCTAPPSKDAPAPTESAAEPPAGPRPTTPETTTGHVPPHLVPPPPPKPKVHER